MTWGWWHRQAHCDGRGISEESTGFFQRRLRYWSRLSAQSEDGLDDEDRRECDGKRRAQRVDVEKRALWEWISASAVQGTPKAQGMGQEPRTAAAAVTIGPSAKGRDVVSVPRRGFRVGGGVSTHGRRPNENQKTRACCRRPGLTGVEVWMRLCFSKLLAGRHGLWWWATRHVVVVERWRSGDWGRSDKDRPFQTENSDDRRASVLDLTLALLARGGSRRLVARTRALVPGSRRSPAAPPETCAAPTNLRPHTGAARNAHLHTSHPWLSHRPRKGQLLEDVCLSVADAPFRTRLLVAE